MQNPADDGVIGEHVIVIVTPLSGGARYFVSSWLAAYNLTSGGGGGRSV
jgi:hypothetical protein